MNDIRLRLLASGNNERGDLFTRLVRDLFFALGYTDLRLDVHKSGRELDLIGSHRFEPRRVIAECKAHQEKMGGAEVNKFFGVLSRERIKDGAVTGYFVSLSGFRETAIQQEIDTGSSGVILLDGRRVVKELSNCNLIVPATIAFERAGQCVNQHRIDGITPDNAELLGHDLGYIWAIYYSTGKHRSHVALIHADGIPIGAEAAQKIMLADESVGGNMKTLQHLAPISPGNRDELQNSCLELYKSWLSEECGFIQLDGLPADSDLSSARLKLERLFVPLRATALKKNGKNGSEEGNGAEVQEMLVGELLSRSPHLAFLAMPGGGKSTLIKRLAMAYAFPARRAEVPDSLPPVHWMPLILRCRELRTRVNLPIIQLLKEAAAHANMDDEQSECFHNLVHSHLRDGKMLLLIDGLDEISDEGDRQQFASNLRTFVGMFPSNAIVITSREAGFRHVAGVISGICEGYRIAPLNEEDVLSLCERWHVEVVGDNAKVRADSIQLAETIWASLSLRSLAENPLMLTTLLVVRRSAGQLPRSRAALYREAIRVLVRTWNVEGYAPMDEDETLAQLSYIACAMMEERKQQIGQTALIRLLRAARQELEAELQFAKISPQEFIQRIEYRSSLLMQTGYERNENGVEPVYEFRHLTFQEYLAARGYVQEQYRGRDGGKALEVLLEPYFNDGLWQEVIPLAAVLAGRKAEGLINGLLLRNNEDRLRDTMDFSANFVPAADLIYKCIVEEVQLTAPTLRQALIVVADDEYAGLDVRDLEVVIKGKFGPLFRQLLDELTLDDPGKYLPAYSDIVCLEDGYGKLILTPMIAESLAHQMAAGSTTQKVSAALLCMNIAFNSVDRGDMSEEMINEIGDLWERMKSSLAALLFLEDKAVIYASAWALAWLGERNLGSGLDSRSLFRLFEQWQSNVGQRSHFLSWAFATQPLLNRDAFAACHWNEGCDEFLKNEVEEAEHHISMTAALIVAWHRRAPWDDLELVSIAKKNFKSSSLKAALEGLLKNLGEEGEQALSILLKDETY
jgi:hypothetical protein